VAVGGTTAIRSGILLVNKPRGITSFGVISRLRKLTGIRRIGHTGTLDPFAEGLLPVCIGRATVAVRFMSDYDKQYILGVEFGRSTDTQDLTGATIHTKTLGSAEQAELTASDFQPVRQAINALRGDHLQIPPMYSAVKVDGRPLYDYARSGRKVDRPARTVSIKEIVVEEIGLEDGILRAVVRVDCSKGTYMRTLADDLGQRTGYYAHATTLVRSRCGPFELADAVDLEQLFDWSRQGIGQQSFMTFLHNKGLLLDISRAFDSFPACDLPADLAAKLISGQSLVLSEDFLLKNQPFSLTCRPELIPENGRKLVFYSRNRLICVAGLEEAEPAFYRIKTERVLIDLADFRQS
jgi:tRNA pseudouridine55 synthase